MNSLVSWQQNRTHRSRALTKEQVRAAIHGQAPVVPRVLHWYNSETLRLHSRLIEKLRRSYPDDMIVPWPRGPDWGLQHRRGLASSWAENFPLADWDNFDAWAAEHFPDPRNPADLSPITEAVAAHPDRYILAAWPLGIFERVHALRPMDLVLIDLFEGDRRLFRLIDMLTDLYISVAEHYARLGADGFRFTDDWGMQDRMIIRPQTWREIFKPRYAAIFSRCHELGVDVLFHSCGAVEAILPDLIEVGVDIIHPLQPGPMDHKRAAEIIGGRIAAAGGIDVQGTMVNGTPDDVRREIREWVEIFFHNGRVILWPTNTIMPETSLENIIAAFEASETIRHGPTTSLRARPM